MKKYESHSKIRLDKKRLARLRAGREWTQAMAARNAGISREAYLSAESGNEIQAVTAGKIAKLFGADVEDIEAKVDRRVS